MSADDIASAELKRWLGELRLVWAAEDVEKVL